MRSKGVPPILKLKAFGLFVRGDMTYYEIAEAIGIAAVNPSTAACRARTAAIGGWEMVRARNLWRWRHLHDWRVLGEPHSGARLFTRPPDEPPPEPPTHFETLMALIGAAESFAQEHRFSQAWQGLRNMRAALSYNEREDRKKASAK